MTPQAQVSLQAYSTMRLGGTAAYLAEVASRQELTDALAWAEARGLPLMMIGGGSNIIWRDEGFNGLIVVNKILGYEDFAEDELNHYLTIGAGEIWDQVVARSVEAGLSGIECLSLIPGSTGATPVQNVGAYGQEVADTLVSLEAYDRKVGAFINIPNEDCAFGYRTSRFKTTDKGRFLITAITLHLMALPPEPPFYAGLQKYLDDHKVPVYTAQTIRQAVIDIRRRKLPDPAEHANTGSFFSNPVVPRGVLTQIQANYPNVPYWDVKGGVKLSAAWLLDETGFHDFHDQASGMATWPPQPLVLVNEHAESTSQLLAFRQKIINAVKAKFDITLQQEPELLP